MFNQLKNTIFYKILKNIYHKTNHYKIKNLKKKIDDTTNELNYKNILLDQIVSEQLKYHIPELDKTYSHLIYTFDLDEIKKTQITCFEYVFETKFKTVADELRKLDDFVFIPNSGNLGDTIIAEAEFQIFSSIGLRYKVLDLYNDNNYNQQLDASCCVYGGGGLFNELYKFENIIEIFKLKHLKKVIILPSSFHECNDLLKVFDERFIVFCREENSYKYCLSMNNKARFLLSHDMAFNFDLSFFTPKMTVNENVVGNFNIDSSKNLYEHYYFVYTILNNITKSINEKTVILSGGQKLGIMLRTDEESIIHASDYDEYKNNSIDLSSFGQYTNTDPGLVKAISLIFTLSLNYFDIIITDRLHIGITAAIMKKKVFLLDNNYGKLSGVFDHSMRDFDNVCMCKNIHDIENVIDVNLHHDRLTKAFVPFTIQMTFKEFLSIYFSTVNTKE
jgi:exopolysaccharide biosynthesis predicted pyruvyltransferase EpsI